MEVTGTYPLRTVITYMGLITRRLADERIAQATISRIALHGDDNQFEKLTKA